MDYSKGFLKEKKINQGVSESYLETYNALFNHIKNSKSLDLGNLDTFNLENTLKFFREKSHLWKVGGYNSYRKVYNVFIKYLVREYRIYDFTSLFKCKAAPVTLPQLFSDNELKRILSYSNEDEKNISLFFLYTGVRKFEFLALKKEDIKNGCIRIRKGKGKKERLIPVHNDLEFVVEKLTYNYTEYYLDSISKKYKKIVKNFHWHRFRHTNATSLIRNGVDIYSVSELLGHSSIETTTIYLSLDINKKKEALNKLSFNF